MDAVTVIKVILLMALVAAITYIVTRYETENNERRRH